MKWGTLLLFFLISMPIVLASLGGQTVPAEEDAEVTDLRVEETLAEPGVLPTSPFYGLKRLVERVRLFFAPEAEKEMLRTDFAQRRAAEAYALLQEGEQERAKVLIQEAQEPLVDTMGVNGIFEEVVETVIEKQRQLGGVEEICAQVTTPAMKPNGRCRIFATPCDVPEGWKPVERCPVLDTDEVCQKGRFPAMSASGRCEVFLSSCDVPADWKRVSSCGGLDSVDEVCIQVITPAMDERGMCKHFPSPCDIPEGWKQVRQCETDVVDEIVILS